MPKLFERQCPECGKINHFESSQALFCPKEPGKPWCKKIQMNRNTVEGGPLVPYLKAWRKSRHCQKGDPIGSIVLNDLCQMIDRLIEQDRLAGRAQPVEYIKQRYRAQGLGGLLEFEPVAKVKKEKVAA